MSENHRPTQLRLFPEDPSSSRLFRMDMFTCFEHIIRELKEQGIRDSLTMNKITYLWLRAVAYCQDPHRAARPVGMIMGPTGAGKTHMVSSLCRALGLPHIVVDTPSLVSSGIVGQSVIDVVTGAYVDIHGRDGPQDRIALLVFDDIHALGDNHVYGQAIHKELLSVLAGDAVPASDNRPLRELAQTKAVRLPPLIPTTPLIPILVGSFDGLLTRRKNTHCGFAPLASSKKLGNELADMNSSDLFHALERIVRFPAELLGRVTTPPIVLGPPTGEDLRRILALEDDRNPLHNLLKEIMTSSVKISYETQQSLVADALARGFGYRSLRQACEELVALRLGDLVASSGRELTL